MLKIEDILREDFDWENVEIDENEFDELENQLIINYLVKILYLIFDYPHKHYTFKHFEV